jgi:cytochrome c peroxidase
MMLNLNTIRVAVALLLVVSQTGAAATDITTTSSEPIKPIPLYADFNAAKAALGAKLFVDARLSHDSSHSCASCHQLGNGGTLNVPVVRTDNDILPVVNIPTVFNATYNYRHGWFGSGRTLSDQINTILRFMSTTASGENLQQIITERINQNSEYHNEITRLYRTDVSVENLIDALTEYVKSLVTPNARFDRYLRGDESAITDEEKQGYILFKEYGCISCHQGVNVGGNLYQKFGIFYKYFEARGNIVTADNGRFNITGRAEDMHVFRVPSLRNVEITAPYLHDGEAKTLEQVVEIMGRTQLGKFLNSSDIDLIVKFLKTLTGEYNGRPLGETRGS